MTATSIQLARANQILASLQADGRFGASLWVKEARVRVYVRGSGRGDYGYLAIGADGTVYPTLGRCAGNVLAAAGYLNDSWPVLLLAAGVS